MSILTRLRRRLKLQGQCGPGGTKAEVARTTSSRRRRLLRRFEERQFAALAPADPKQDTWRPRDSRRRLLYGDSKSRRRQLAKV